MSISKTYSNLLGVERKPFSSVCCEDDCASCLKRKLQEQYTGGIFSHSAGCLHTSRSDLIQMSCFLRSLSFLYLSKIYGFTDSHGTLSIKHTSTDVDLQYPFEGRAYSNPRTGGLNLHPLLLYLSLTFVLREALCNSEHVEGSTVYNKSVKRTKNYF